MNIEKYRLKFDCPVLKSHNDRFQAGLDKTKPKDYQEYNLYDIFQNSDLQIYRGKTDSIFPDFKIEGKVAKEVEQFLENLAVLYLAGKRQNATAYFLSDQVKLLPPIETQALNLRKLLESFQEIPNAFDLLFYFQGKYNGSNSERGISNLISRLVKDLEELESLSSSIKNSEFAEAFKIGRAGQKGNPENQQWVSYLRQMWFTILGRDFKFDRRKKSGRENFLLFAEDCFEVFYPGAKQDLVRKTLEQIEKDERLLLNSTT